jgi:hypothetical protein
MITAGQEAAKTEHNSQRIGVLEAFTRLDLCEKN